MTSQTFLMTSFVKSFDRKSEKECLTKRNIAALREYQHHHHSSFQGIFKSLAEVLPCPPVCNDLKK